MRLAGGLASLLLLCPLAYPAGVVAIYPSPTDIIPGNTKQFQIYDTTSGASVTWSVNGITGGSAVVGTITSAGLYTAPALVPASNVVTVIATSNPSGIFGSSAVRIHQPTPTIWSANPNTFSTGMNQTISLNGANFENISTVQLGGMPVVSMFVSSTAIQLTANLMTAGTFPITVTNPGNGAATSAPVNITVKTAPPPPITVSVNPTSASVVLGASASFAATVANTSNTVVTWSASAGNITAMGVYTAPATMPSNPTVTITAQSQADPTKSGTATVTLLSSSTPITVSVNPPSANVSLGASTPFVATVTGSANTAVNWSATAGSITTAGVYTAPSSMPATPSVTITAQSQADPSKSGTASVTLQSGAGPGTPGNNSADLHAGRFLEQAAFGPSPADLTFIHQNTTTSTDGTDVWLANQLAMSPSVIGLPAQSNTVQSDTLHRIATAPDQLRQKMAWALSQFIVISMNKNIYPDEYVPYQQILANDAFGNFRQLLWDITVSPQMGKYLDLANSNKAGVGSGANENYAREVMQLFTIGLNMLNPDGSNVLDSKGNPIPTYLQPDIVHTAAALTGWTYPTAPGATPQPNNWEDFSQPVMETRQGNHDVTAKTLINGCSLPANQSVTQDTNGVLDCIFNHPNVGPFVATRLIRFLVTSNPTPGYIARVASVFNNNGSGVRGDLKAVLTAILKDPEARQDTITVDASGNPYYILNGANVNYNPGRLKDPIYLIVAFVRAMNGTIPVGTIIPYNFVAMGETVVNPPSVFGYYSPLYHLPLNPALFGPEFQIYTPTESVEEANMLQSIITQPNSDPSIDLSGFNAAVATTPALLDLADQKFYYGRMPAQVRTAIATAIDANTDNPSRVFTAVYLAVLAGQYQTQY